MKALAELPIYREYLDGPSVVRGFPGISSYNNESFNIYVIVLLKSTNSVMGQMKCFLCYLGFAYCCQKLQIIF